MRPSRAIVPTIVFLVLLHLSVGGAGFLAPYTASTQFREYAYAPPARVHFMDGAGGIHVRPFVYPSKSDWPSGEYVEDRDRVIPTRFFVRGDSYSVLGVFDSNLHLFGVDEPAHIFLLGTDGYGRDQFARFLFGGQISLFAGLMATSLSLLVGLLLGAAAGYHGGLIDAALMRTTEIFGALPWLYLLLALRGVLPLHLSAGQTFVLITAVVGLVGWSRPARLVRGIVLTAKERNYVLAARGFGASDLYLLRRHVLPQTRGVMLTQAALLIPQYILAEVTLSFLGLGVAEPVPSWGNLLSSLQQYSVLNSYWWMIVPGFLMIPVFLGYYVLAQSLESRVQSSP